MQDDVGFKSQQFGEQVAQRRDRYAEQNIQTGQRMQQLPIQYQAMQHQELEMQMRQQQNASQLATDELRRQDAIMQLQWARELHTTDMLAMQRDAAQVDLDLKRAQAKKIMSDLDREDDLTPAYLRMDAEDRDNMIENGHFVEMSGGKMRMRLSTEAERAAAAKRNAARSTRSYSAKVDPTTDPVEIRQLLAEYRRQLEMGDGADPEGDAVIKQNMGVLLRRLERLQGIKSDGANSFEEKVKTATDSLFDSIYSK